jgi:hypothetical protein
MVKASRTGRVDMTDVFHALFGVAGPSLVYGQVGVDRVLVNKGTTIHARRVH